MSPRGLGAGAEETSCLDSLSCPLIFRRLSLAEPNQKPEDEGSWLIMRPDTGREGRALQGSTTCPRNTGKKSCRVVGAVLGLASVDLTEKGGSPQGGYTRGSHRGSSHSQSSGERPSSRFRGLDGVQGFARVQTGSQDGLALS